MKNIEGLKNLQLSKKYTLFYFSELGFPVTEKIMLDNVEIASYEKYKRVIKLYYSTSGKHKLKTFLPQNTLIIWKGWKNVNANYYIDGKADKCFSENYIIRAINSVLKKPLIY
ncbi:hypothetical protein U732_3 [Clostridium argentinense CDC 2741]|uniref:Uncharacterized protein n=2 Tax=Clostridium argentinense TaxID=29341 RepID=A0A0C1R3F4_9CLOT|nr:hypothetical protein [Clostridium argentinense]ARC83136.1 hypothetical protein RSJ17_00350 [Clostridium argentinense]KIE44981.1 hypothetical protein U732_3 [Clostridium argentinense CDC 2741]NFF41310.1 hypothetical protein [Clostridium argentinense]NFP51795.1 hypothetical protein [Clostridium argentinense]NFP74235.1 hypothetical protein [Clostridium argentinense]